ncbi:lipocalin family protein [Syntrophotalea acetylenica]|jgi:apolipoprotein D and lipocalin family protein|uniref:lipocalin family protein n=1 Tax=Syntrophotalea acetylenica TaxID=29542 RepID=UPI00090AEA92|nr:lipocalin family protein [Syntrophotalea acetylenica]APG44206.1 hypothetical protein A6070_08885 [Syntrophotalea acetylenica]MDY0261110.1 lipocalin family protein [Syntrophotalea acetylenica]
MLRNIIIVLIAMTVAGCRFPTDSPRVVANVDLHRYVGTWYEIARYPNRFQKGCSHVTATYRMLDDGHLEVVNRCRRDDREQAVAEITGRARAAGDSGDGKLKVTFFWPFYGHYWIIDLAEDYSWAVVGHPRRKYLWILARQPYLAGEVLEQLLRRLEGQGYDASRLIFTDQGTSSGPFDKHR